MAKSEDSKAIIPQRMGKPVGKELFDADPKRVKWVLQRLKELAKQYQEIQLEMAPLITEVATGEFHKHEGYDRFDEYCQAELGLGIRKVEYLLKIQKNLLLQGVEKKRLNEIGWWKAALIATLPPVEREKEKVDAWIEKAGDTGTSKFHEAVNKAKNHHLGKKRHPEEITERMAFALYEGQIKNVKQAIELAGQISGSEVKSHNLDLICTAFQADRLEESDVKLAHILKAVERCFKVKCIAIKDDKGEAVEFGARTAKKYGVT